VEGEISHQKGSDKGNFVLSPSDGVSIFGNWFKRATAGCFCGREACNIKFIGFSHDHLLLIWIIC